MTFKPVKKAVLPVAGLGTRFLPATKAMPKEMLTVVDKPLIQYAVEEALEAGIEEFIFVTGRGKDALENHFDLPYELIETLKAKGKTKELEAVVNIIPQGVKLYYTRQGNPRGLGHAINCAAGVVGDEPCAVLLPDDIICTNNGNALKDMIAAYNETGKSVVLCEEVPHEMTKKYGILDTAGAGVQNGRTTVQGLVEKPEPNDAPSNLAVVGRYVLTPSHFAHLAKGEIGAGGEIQLTDAMDKVAREEGFIGQVFDGKRFDCGDKVGFQMANLYFAMQDEYIGERLLPYLHQTANQYERRTEPRAEAEAA